MALQGNAGGAKPRAKRLPHESANDWTLRTARLRCYPNGKWKIDYTRVITCAGGRDRFRTCAEATGTASETEAQIYLSRWRQDFAQVANAGALVLEPTLDDLCERYLEDGRTRQMHDSQRLILVPVRASLGHLRASEIEGALHGYHVAAQRKYKSGSIRRHLSALFAVLNHAVRTKRIDRSLVPDYKLPAHSPPRSYHLNKDEDAKAFALAKTWAEDGDTEGKRKIGLFVCLALATAARRGAILDLTWDRVDLKRRQIDFNRPGHAARNKRRALVPILPRLLPVLEQAAGEAELRSAEKVRLVVGLADAQRLFKSFREAVGLPRLTPHVCRHTWATLASEAGVDHWVMSDMMADSITTIGRTYRHANMSRMTEVLTAKLGAL